MANSFFNFFSDRFENREGRLIIGTSRTDRLEGGNFNDTIEGRGGRDFISGSPGDDLISGGTGRDFLFGGFDDDTISGGEGNDEIIGGFGKDTATYEADFLTVTNTSVTANFDVIDNGIGTFLDNTIFGFTIIDRGDNDLGRDNIRSIEHIQFDDFKFSIDGTNNGPLVFDNIATTDEDNPVNLRDALLANDFDFERDVLGLDDDITIVGVNDADTNGSATLDPDSGEVIYDPEDFYQFLADGESAEDTFTYTIEDNGGLQSTATVTVTVEGVNDRPTVEDIAFSIGEDDDPVTFAFDGDDIDATDILSFFVNGQPARGQITNNDDGTFTFNPGSDFQFLNDGEISVVDVTYQAQDDSGTANDTSEEATITITVNGSDDDPVELTDTLNFETENQSTFGTGAAFVFDPMIAPITILNLDESFDFDIALGFDLQGALRANLALAPFLEITSGDFDAQLTGEIGFNVPRQVIPGQQVTIESGFLLADGSVFQTTSPNITFGIDLVYDLLALAEIRNGDDEVVLSIINFGDAGTTNLFTLDASDIAFTLPLPFDSEVAFAFPVNNTNGTLNPITQTISSAGTSNPFIEFTFDVDGLLSGVVPAIPPFGVSVDIGPISGSFDLLDIDLVAGLSIGQIFNFTLGEIAGTIILEGGQGEIDFIVGQDIDFILPEDFDFGDNEQLDFTTVININGDGSDDSIGALLEQIASINFDLDLAVKAFAGSLTLDALVTDIVLADFALFDETFELVDDLALANIFEDEFGVTDFNDDSADFFIDASLENMFTI